MAAMTLPMVPPSFGYGRSDPRTPPESSVLRTTRGLKPSQTATPEQRREVHRHAAFRMVPSLIVSAERLPGTAARRAAHSLAALGRARVLHVPAPDGAVDHGLHLPPAGADADG